MSLLSCDNTMLYSQSKWITCLHRGIKSKHTAAAYYISNYVKTEHKYHITSWQFVETVQSIVTIYQW